MSKKDKLIEHCPDCKGEGKIQTGEHFVTREMAIDAGYPEMEGSHCEYEYERCSNCEGSGQTEVMEK